MHSEEIHIKPELRLSFGFFLIAGDNMVKEKEWFKAIREGHVNVITNLLNALRDRKPERIKNLVKQLHSVDGTQSTALHLSCQYNHSTLVKILLQNGANPNILDQSGCTSLHLAAWNGNDAICQLIVEHSQVAINVNSKNAAGETAMHLASQHGHDKVVEILLGLGSNMDVTNSFDQTPLMLACLYGRRDCVASLVNHLDNETKQKSDYNSIENSPMHMAAHNGHAYVVGLLIDKGFPVNVKASGGTCLHEAVLWNRIQVVETLLQHNIDETLCNADGKTALDLLKRNHQKYGIIMKEKILEYTEKKATAAAEMAEEAKLRLTEDHPDYVPAGAAEKISDYLSTPDDENIELKIHSIEEDTDQLSTAEVMRRYSEKCRREFESICLGDSDSEEDAVFTDTVTVST